MMGKTAWVNGYDHGIPTNCRFIKVTGDDGNFYDLVNLSDAKAHIAKLMDDGYEAIVVNRDTVPACRFRDFTGSVNLITYTDATWKKGTELYFAF